MSDATRSLNGKSTDLPRPPRGRGPWYQNDCEEKKVRAVDVLNNQHWARMMAFLIIATWGRMEFFFLNIAQVEYFFFLKNNFLIQDYLSSIRINKDSNITQMVTITLLSPLPSLRPWVPAWEPS